MKKVLVFGFTDTIGGVETFFMTYYNKFDKEKYQFDFVTVYENMVFSEEIKYNGGKVYKITDFKKNVFQYKKEVRSIILENNYDVIYVNMLSAANLLPIKIAKELGVKKVIAHSHNSNTPNSFLKKILHRLNKDKIPRYANVLVACSNKAGAWMFGENKFDVLNNAIDTEKFRFDEKYRNESKSTFVIGHVGRFCEAKNQDFIINVFNKVIEYDRNFSLILIGDGEDKEKIKEKIEQLKINNYIQIIDGTMDVYKYYSKFDLFILPSKFEGLPIVGIEAQANGLPCLFSDEITEELRMNENVAFLPIDNIDVWVKEILKRGKRTKQIKLKNFGYDINYNYKIFEDLIND